MRWNWEQSDWPDFRWNKERLAALEARFLHGSGLLFGTTRHLTKEHQDELLASEMSVDALSTSEIEGEFLNRASVQSSIQKQLGLAAEESRATPAERGISELMVSLYRGHEEPLTHELLFGWHRMVMSGRNDIQRGAYRTNAEPMQIVSGPIYAHKVHFEAPPSARVPEEMERFVQWFQSTAPGSGQTLPPLTRAGISHVYFESIHPFEDGNGRIGRAIAEKALVQSLGEPLLVLLGRTILAHHRDYYSALEKAHTSNEVSEWLLWFAEIALEAQQSTLAHVEFLIEKTKLLDGLRDKMNPRQAKALLRMLQEGPKGFIGGMSAQKYGAITNASPATATRDLAALVNEGALLRTGERKHTRYLLNLPMLLSDKNSAS